MRLVLLLPVLISVATPAYAEGARESRYGPSSPRQASTAVATYTGPLLGWANKQTPSAASADVSGPAARPASIAPWARYQPVRAVSSPSMTAAPVSLAAALPNSLYAPPRAAPIAAAPIPPAPPRQQVAAVAGTTGARFYSVSRESGLQPDPIPPVSPNNQVLVTADALAPQPDGAAPVHGSADWLAAGVNGDDDQDNDGDRRAKTRKQDQ